LDAEISLLSLKKNNTSRSDKGVGYPTQPFVGVLARGHSESYWQQIRGFLQFEPE
jgi:hypothetical protein